MLNLKPTIAPAILTAAMAFSGTVIAGPQVGTSAPDLYCSNQTQGLNLTVGNLTLNNTNADDCYGHVNISDHVPSNGQSTSAILAFANQNYSGATPANALWGGDWSFIVRDDGANQVYSQDYEGFRFDLSAPQGATTGVWTLAVTDLTPNDSPYLPITMDLMVFIKGATAGDFFLFNGEMVQAANAGTFKMTFTQGSNTNGNGLSGFSLLGRDLAGSDCAPGSTLPGCRPTEIAEPGSLALFGIALGMMNFVRRRTGRSAGVAT